MDENTDSQPGLLLYAVEWKSPTKSISSSSIVSIITLLNEFLMCEDLFKSIELKNLELSIVAFGATNGMKNNVF